MQKLLTVLSVIVLATDLCAQTIVSGPITGTWTPENSPYLVSGNIDVVDSLIIEPCVTIKFNTGGLKIEAGSGDKFVARGTPDCPIIFEPYIGQNPGSYVGISLNSSGNDDTLRHCLIRYATNGVYAYDSEPTIYGCIVYGSSENGIFLLYYHNADSAILSDCSIFNNETAGVRFQGYARYGNMSATGGIHRCAIYSNGLNGIIIVSGTWYTYYSAYAMARIANCTILDNPTGVEAYAYRGYADATITNTIIAYNGGYGVANQDSRSFIGPNDITNSCFWYNGLSDFSPDISYPGFGQNGPYQNTNGDSCDINLNTYYDPLFVDTASNDYHLQVSSKCIDAGTPIIMGQFVLDPDSTTPDIGAFYCEQMIACPQGPIEILACSLSEELCVSLPIIHADSVNAGKATWGDDSLCFAVDSLGEYVFQVIACNAQGNDTCDVTVNVASSTPPVPEIIHCYHQNDTAFIEWQPVPLIDEYIIYRNDSRYDSTSSCFYEEGFQGDTVLYQVASKGEWFESDRSDLSACVLSGVEEIPSSTLPEEFYLEQNYPNPFNPETRIEFSLAKSSFVTIRVFNILGEQVRTLVCEPLKAGYKVVTWDAKDENGADVASGIYIYRIQAGEFSESKRMVLLK